jgi:hypothetical protein
VEDDNQDDSFCFTEDDPYSVREIEQSKITDGRDAEAHLDLVFTTLVDNLQALDINNAASLQATRRVQGDVFHMMKRPRPASKHSFLNVYAESLSYAFFIRNVDDEEKVYSALIKRDFTLKEITKIVLKDHNYTRLRIRRRIRPPGQLAAWLTAIFDAFGPIRCSNIKKALLSPKEMKKAKNVVQVSL